MEAHIKHTESKMSVEKKESGVVKTDDWRVNYAGSRSDDKWVEIWIGKVDGPCDQEQWQMEYLKEYQSHSMCNINNWLMFLAQSLRQTGPLSTSKVMKQAAAHSVVFMALPRSFFKTSFVIFTMKKSPYVFKYCLYTNPYLYTIYILNCVNLQS
jgi:hypothetical protein